MILNKLRCHSKIIIGLFSGLSLFALQAFAQERINHAGRILGDQLTVSAPTLFNTSTADAVVSSLQIMPRDNPWNEDISNRPLLYNSAAMINQISTDLPSNRQDLRPFYEMNFVIIPAGQPNVPINFFNYPDESDPSPYPIPANMPVEGWPRVTGGLTNSQWQEDINGDGGDRHSMILQPSTGMLWETWLTKRVGSSWQASNGAKFDINSNALRPAGWTSADAAGLPMFPGVVRYEECQRGEVEHAVRMIVDRTRKEYIYPATHYASVPETFDPNVPAMGQRLRLKASFSIPGYWTMEAKAVAMALKKYGGIVADNGGFLSFSVSPDDRFPDGAFDDLRDIAVDDFEVVQTTGPTEGPRSPGAPTADAGEDQIVHINSGAMLDGSATGSSLTTTWYAYPYTSQPGSTTFNDTALLNTVVNFDTVGTYTLMLKVEDGIHTPAYDVVEIIVTATGNAPPTAHQQNLEVFKNQSLVLTLSGEDPEEEPLTYHLESQPSHGTLSGTPPNLTYIPNEDFTGKDSFSFTVNDGELSSFPAAINMKVVCQPGECFQWNLVLPAIIHNSQ